MTSLQFTPYVRHRVRGLRAAGACAAFVVVAGAVVAAQQKQDPVAEARRYFTIADYDQSGWISSSEAGQALLASREEFFRYDIDRDGGITWTEFYARYTAIVVGQGLFQPPIPAPNKAPLLPTPTRVWFERFDTNRSNSWDRTELTRALAEVELEDKLDDSVWSSFDADGSGAIEADEIDAVMTFTSSTRRDGGGSATNLRELFGVVLEQKPGPGVVFGPDRLVGPLPVFDRLDVDGNGTCSLHDLELLEFPATLQIRPQTLLAALDLNGDGLLDRAELRAAFGLEL